MGQLPTGQACPSCRRVDVILAGGRDPIKAELQRDRTALHRQLDHLLSDFLNQESAGSSRDVPPYGQNARGARRSCPGGNYQRRGRSSKARRSRNDPARQSRENQRNQTATPPNYTVALPRSRSAISESAALISISGSSSSLMRTYRVTFERPLRPVERPARVGRADGKYAHVWNYFGVWVTSQVKETIIISIVPSRTKE
jgi:hypothetical protein